MPTIFLPRRKIDWKAEPKLDIELELEEDCDIVMFLSG